MKLPNANDARVEREKILDYLLSTSHPDGRSKAEFFARFGFHSENWQALARALQSHGMNHPVSRVSESIYGTRYSIDGSLETPDQRNPLVRTVWMIEQESNSPRLITAYPIRR